MVECRECVCVWGGCVGVWLSVCISDLTVHPFVCVCVHIYICMCELNNMLVHTRVCMRTRVHECIRVHVCMHTCIYTYVYTFV